jgi:uroporphyrinogen decarboxylase
MTTQTKSPMPKSFVRAIRGEIQARPCFWLMRQAGRYLPEYRATRAQAKGFVDLCLRPDLATEITLQPIRRYGMDAAILFSDILMIPHGLGQKLEFKEGEGPVLESVTDAAGIAALEKGLDGCLEKLGPIFETVSRVKAALPLDTALIGFAGAPWTVATYMVEGGGSKDFAKVRLLAARDPALFEKLIDVLIEATTRYLSRQIDAGAEVLQLFDTWAGVLPEDEYQRWAIEPVKEIIAQVRERHPSIPIIYFPKGSGMLYTHAAAETGADALGIDTSVPMEFAKLLQHQVTVQGNLDPIKLAAGGKAMEESINRILAALAGGRFVFNLGHGVIPQTPPEHVARLAEIIRGWRHRAN